MRRILIASLRVAASATVFAQTPTTPEEWIAKAKAVSDLRAPGSPPFHLHAEFTAIGVNGQSDNGSLDLVWASPDTWREDVSLGQFHLVRTRLKNNIYEQPEAHCIPISVQWILRHILPDWNPEEPESVKQSPWQTVNAAAPDIVELAVQSGKGKSGPPQRSLAIDTVNGRVVRFMGADYSEFRLFAGKQVATAGQRILDSSTVEAFVIRKIETIELPQESTFQLSTVATRTLNEPSIFLAPTIAKLHQPDTRDPSDNQLAGTFVLEVGIDDKGQPQEIRKVHQLQVTAARLSKARVTEQQKQLKEAEIMKMTMKCKFKPATIDGQPVPWCCALPLTSHTTTRQPSRHRL